MIDGFGDSINCIPSKNLCDGIGETHPTPSSLWKLFLCVGLTVEFFLQFSRGNSFYVTAASVVSSTRTHRRQLYQRRREFLFEWTFEIDCLRARYLLRKDGRVVVDVCFVEEEMKRSPVCPWFMDCDYGAPGLPLFLLNCGPNGGTRNFCDHREELLIS